LLPRPAPLFTAIVLGACLSAASPIASAQTPATKQQTPNQVQAEQHFQRARVLYKAGNYREAIGELEKAHTLDPAAKDLVLNLATVSEKIGRIDDALKYTHEYEQTDLTPTEHDHAEAAIRRKKSSTRRRPRRPRATNSSNRLRRHQRRRSHDHTEKSMYSRSALRRSLWQATR